MPFGQFTLCRAYEDFPVCVAVMYLTLRTGCEKHGRKNPLPYPFSKRSHIGNLRQIRKQGKGRSSKRKENRRLSFLFAPAAGRGTLPPSADGESPAEVQRKTPRPSGTNPPAAVRVPRSAGAGKKEPPRQGRTRLWQFVCPGQPAQKRSRPSGANTLTQFVCPGQPVQRKEPPVRANTLTQFAHPAQPVQRKEPPGQGEPPARFRCPNRPVQRKRVPHMDTCPPVKIKYFYALHYKSDVL